VDVWAFVNSLIIALAAFGVSFWAFRARTDRSARVGLYLLFGIPAVLLGSVALAQLLVGEPEDGVVVLALGLGLGLPLLRPVRRLVAAVTPIDPGSPVDMTGLCVMLALLGFLLFGQGISDSPPEEIGAVGLGDLALQVALFVVLAYASVGWWFARTGREATERLGIVRPTWRAVGVALLAVPAALIVAGAVNGVALLVQPELGAELAEITDELTAEVQNPVGALLLGASAGIGEEALFRGALQPRFGIVLVSIVFALVHAPQYGLNLAVLGLFGVSVVLGLERKYVGTTAAMVTHALYNTLAVLAQTYA
jgi:membrane protease YdiL (CAAX protease family)